MLIVQDDMIYPLEFKKSAKVDKNIVRQFEILNKFDKKVAAGGIICLIDSLLPITPLFNAIPVAYL